MRTFNSTKHSEYVVRVFNLLLATPVSVPLGL